MYKTESLLIQQVFEEVADVFFRNSMLESNYNVLLSSELLKDIATYVQAVDLDMFNEVKSKVRPVRSFQDDERERVQNGVNDNATSNTVFRSQKRCPICERITHTSSSDGVCSTTCSRRYAEIQNA